MINGHTKLVGLIGWPVEHSLSPAMHNAAFDALGLNWRYVPLPVEPGRVKVALRGLAALGFQGANVTVPHKQAIMKALCTDARNSVAPGAKESGAVNTIVVERSEDGTIALSGHNTDVQGFVGALRQGGFEPQGNNAVVVGAGGAARAVVFGLLGAGISHIVVLNRTFERAQALVSGLCGEKDERLRALPLVPETLIESARAADLLVNTTPLGMWPRVDGSIWPDAVPVPPHLTVFDLVYNPLETQLVRQARESGARTIEGLGMLALQGALAFDMWTHHGPAIDEITGLMRAACERALPARL
jgi:shikimate dehydrogenase